MTKGLHSKHAHHAYIIEGPREEARAAACAFLREELSFEPNGNPDFFELRVARFGIEDSHALHARALTKAIAGERKALMAVFESITHEAQNALLKLLEEPPPGTHLFLLVPSRELLLPTARSRMQVLARSARHSSTAGASAYGGEHAAAFFAAGAPERLAMLETLIAARDAREAIAFINALEAYLYENAPPWSAEAEVREAYEELARSREYLGDRAPSLKLILEHVALTAPRITS